MRTMYPDPYQCVHVWEEYWDTTKDPLYAHNEDGSLALCPPTGKVCKLCDTEQLGLWSNRDEQPEKTTG